MNISHPVRAVVFASGDQLDLLGNALPVVEIRAVIDVAESINEQVQGLGRGPAGELDAVLIAAPVQRGNLLAAEEDQGVVVQFDHAEQRGVAGGQGRAVKRAPVALAEHFHALGTLHFQRRRQVRGEGREFVQVIGSILITGCRAGTSGSVSPGARCLRNSSRKAWNFGVAQPASLMGAS